MVNGRHFSKIFIIPRKNKNKKNCEKSKFKIICYLKTKN